MRLIDADVFEKFIRRNCKDSLADLWCELVRRQPTAYDVEKVVEKLEEKALNTSDTQIGISARMAFGKAIEIVKSGI